MDRGVSEHLSATALADLAEAVRQQGRSIPRAEDVDPHLAICSACRDQFEEYVLLDRQLEQLKSSEPALHQAECPDSALWREIAAGVTPPKQALAHIQHASRCDHCGPLLREAMSEVTGLSRATTESEQAEVAALASAQPEWQRDIAERMAGATRCDPSPAPWWKAWATIPRLAMAGAALAAVVAVAYWIVAYSRDSNSAGRLLARAYTEQRTLEVRFRGAAYAPLRVQRGPEASFADRPPSLLKAEALIASQLPSHPTDSSWLQAKARADLLEGKYGAAVESLRRALELSPNSPELMVDVASAYFQRAQTEDRPQDYGAAFEYLSKVLAQRPDDPVALFNRAIISEHQFLYHQALDDWERYLQVEPRSEWADEARKRADAVREKLRTHDQSQAAPLLRPLQVAESANNPSYRSDVNQRIEEYLLIAARSWLPQAYPEPGIPADGSAAQALFFLADLTAQQHGDRWLSDLLQGSSSTNFPPAVGALAQAVEANDAGEYDTSRRQAAFAARLFRASGNLAGELRAQFEQVFSAQISRRSAACRDQAATALAESERHLYPWLQAQLGLEAGLCSGLMGDLGANQQAVQRATSRARKATYGALYLRALGFMAADKFEVGDPSGAWRFASTGLEAYWSGQFPAMRGYNLYTEFAYGADIVGRANLQVAVWREALVLINSDKDLLLRANAHAAMANAAVAAGQPQIADEQYAEAARLFALAPQPEATRANRIESEIRRARLEAHQGEFDAALTRLTRAQDEVRQGSNNYLALMFYSTLGELQLRRQQPMEAEHALRPALALAEQRLATLGSEAERTNWSKDTAPAYLALIEAELAQGRSQEALETYEWHLGVPQQMAIGPPPQRSLDDPLMPGPLQLASRPPLLAKETVLAYAPLPDGLAIWEYDDHGINGRWIQTPTEALQELAARFHDLSSDPKSELSAVRRDARSLYESLIAPVERHLTPGRTLVIETEGWLARVPFEAMLDSNDRYLVERSPIVHSMGQDSQARLRSDTSISADLPALVVGSAASSPTAELIPLPDVAAEVDTVASGFHSARVLKGREATLRMVKQQFPAAAVFHFAGHSLATPDKAGLMLADKDPQTGNPTLIDAAVVRSLKLQNLRLAVLSACSTGAGNAEDSSGFSSVTVPLLRAGVPHVVASRWAVDSAETRRFIEDFYRRLLSGQPVSEAIQLTSRSMLSNPRTAHPYYWSAFAVYGRP